MAKLNQKGDGDTYLEFIMALCETPIEYDISDIYKEVVAEYEEVKKKKAGKA